MATRAELKGKFSTGMIPTQADFAEWIDSAVSTEEINNPLKIGSDTESLWNVISFYKGAVEDSEVKWTINIGVDKYPGFAINDVKHNRFFIEEETGNVGIGTNTPIGKLQIQNGNSATVIGNNTMGCIIGSNNAGYELNLVGGVPNGQGNMGGQIRLGASGRGDNAKNAIQFLQNGSEKMRIHDGGNVGIGTSNPQAKLQVVGGAIMPSVGSTKENGIYFPENPAGIGGESGDAAWIRYYVREKESTTFEIGTSDNVDDHIALMPSGNVGIGTTTPAAKLHVAASTMVIGKANGEKTFIMSRPSGLDLYFGDEKWSEVGLFYSGFQLERSSYNFYVEGTIRSGHSDFAELFESEDGEKIEIGTSVCSNSNGLIRRAENGEIPFGVISVKPAILGNSNQEWHKKFVKDEFGNKILQTVEEEIENQDGKKEIVEKEIPILNKEYDPKHEYIRRDHRPEWHPVGLLGQLHLRKGQPVAPTWVKIKDISENVELWLVK